MHKTTKTRRTLRLINECGGFVRYPSEAEIAKNQAAWKAMSDGWIKNPRSSSNPRLWDAIATLEYALTLPGRALTYPRSSAYQSWGLDAFADRFGPLFMYANPRWSDADVKAPRRPDRAEDIQEPDQEE